MDAVRTEDHWESRKMEFKKLFAAALIGLTLMVTGCGESRGYSRGIFHGMVIDKSEDEVVSKMGKPESIEKIGEEGLRYVYRKKTCDPDNLNQVDDKTFIDFEKKAGRMIVTDVSFG
jgi:hypothetical protein